MSQYGGGTGPRGNGTGGGPTGNEQHYTDRGANHTNEQLQQEDRARAEQDAQIDSNKEPEQQTPQNEPEPAPPPLENGIRSIFKNKFFDKDYRPIPLWSFSVSFLMPNTVITDENGNEQLQQHAFFVNNMNNHSYMYTDESLSTLSYAVVNGTLDKRTMNSVPAYYAGVAMELPSRAITNGEITFTFQENSKMAVTRILEQLLSLVFDQDYCNATKTYRAANGTATYEIVVKIWEPDNANVDATHPYTINDSNRTPPLVYHYYGCWLSNIGEVKMDYTDEGNVITRDATFKYAYMRVYDGYYYYAGNSPIADNVTPPGEGVK